MPSSPPFGVNVFTAPEKPLVGERPCPFGPPLALGPDHRDPALRRP